MIAYVIIFSRGVYLRINYKPLPLLLDTGHYPNSGWCPILWTRELIDAEKFISIESAEAFGMERIPHEFWAVQPISAVVAAGNSIA